MGERGRERTLQEGTVKAHNRALMLRVETPAGKRLGVQKDTEHGLELKIKRTYSFLHHVCMRQTSHAHELNLKMTVFLLYLSY